MSDISEITGLAEADAAERLSQLYEDRGALYDLYRERQLLEDVYEIYEEVKKKAGEAAERNAAGLYNALRQIVVLMFDRLERAKSRNAEELMTINKMHAQIMTEAISLAFDRALFELQKRYPEIERDDLDEVLTESLPLAMKAIEERS